MAPGDILEGVCCGEERRKGGVGGCFPTIGGCSFALVGVWKQKAKTACEYMNGAPTPLSLVIYMHKEKRAS